MTSEERQNISELQADLLGVNRGVWQPCRVARAFCSDARDAEFVFTMQAWIDLSHAHSPFLELRLPEDNVPEALETAFRAFGHQGASAQELSPEEAFVIGLAIVDTIMRAFAMEMPMSPPGGCTSHGVADDGFGDWLPVLACLKSQLGFSLAEALALDVGQVFGLIAAHRSNQGWTPTGETYATRDIPDTTPE